MNGLLLMLISSAHASPLLEFDFATDDGGLTTLSNLQWAWGVPTSGPGASEALDPVWGTQLGGNYLNDASDSLQLPPSDLSNASRVAMAITHWYEMDETGDGDFGWLETQVDGEWVPVTPAYGYPSAGGFSGSSDGWQTDWFVFDEIADASDIRLSFAADPLISRSGWYIQSIDIQEGDPIPPRIQDVEPPTDVQDVIGPYSVRATILDDFLLTEVTLHWSVDGAASKSTDMTAEDDDVFTGEIPGMDPGSTIDWWIRASDGENTARWPQTSTASFRVYLAAPTDVHAIGTRPDGGYAGLEIPIQWHAPESPYTISTYSIYLNGREVGITESTSGNVPLEDGDQSLVVRAYYETPAGEFLGEPSDPYTFFALVPWMDVLSPDVGWQGDTLRVVVQGENLFMDASTVLDLGQDIHTTDLEIVDANHAIFTINIGEDASVGLRDVTLRTADSEYVSDLQFEVSDGEDLPRLLSIQPNRLRQGQHTTLTIHTNVTVVPDPTVNLGAGIFVEDVSVDGETVSVRVASAGSTPLGAHSITVDDGTRVLDGVTIQIVDNQSAPKRVCAVHQPSARSLGGWLSLVIGFIFCRRRTEH